MSEQHPPAPDPQQPAPQPAPQAWPPAASPAPPEWRGATAAAGARSGPSHWWREATSTGGGRAALVVAAVLGVLFLVTGIGLAAALVTGHHRVGEGGGRYAVSRGDDDGMMGPRSGMGPGNGMGRGNGYGRGQGNGNGNKSWKGPQQGPGQANPANPRIPGNGMGLGTGRGMAGLGAVLHGEFTTSITGTPAVMVVQTGQVTAFTAGKSLTVKSTDGFAATYTLDAATPAAGGTGTQLATGSQVRVLAAKDGMKVVWLGAVG